MKQASSAPPPLASRGHKKWNSPNTATSSTLSGCSISCVHDLPGHFPKEKVKILRTGKRKGKETPQNTCFASRPTRSFRAVQEDQCYVISRINAPKIDSSIRKARQVPRTPSHGLFLQPLHMYSQVRLDFVSSS